MKGESPADAKVRPTQSFDAEHGGWCANHRSTDATHVGTVVLSGGAGVICRMALCDECARRWLVGVAS